VTFSLFLVPPHDLKDPWNEARTGESKRRPSPARRASRGSVVSGSSLRGAIRCRPRLVFEQPFLAPESAAVAAERSTGVHDAVAGDEDGDPIASVGHAHGALGPGIANRGGELGIGPGGTAGDGPEGGPDAGFEGRAGRYQGHGEG
jgi:hypothetical protein